MQNSYFEECKIIKYVINFVNEVMRIPMTKVYFNKYILQSNPEVHILRYNTKLKKD